MTKRFQTLHERARKAAAIYLKAESELIEILRQIDDCSGYLELEHTSLRDYAVKALKLSPDVASTLIMIARKAREIPKLQQMIAQREITISNARQVKPVLTVENQERWLEAAATLSKRELEREISTEHPKFAVPEQVKYVARERLEFRTGISEGLHKKIQRVQDLLATSKGCHVGLEEMLECLTDFYLKRTDPMAKAERAKARKAKREQEARCAREIQGDREGEVLRAGTQPTGSFNKHVPAHADPRFMPAALQHEIDLRDNTRCTHVDSNDVRCKHRRFLHYHHQVPIAQGGQTTLENIITVCSGHHRMLHRA